MVYLSKQYFDYICIMKERLKRILEEYGLNSSRLAEKMGIQRSGISHIMAGRNKPSYDFIVSLLKLYPEIDANWLLTGKGSMLKESNKTFREESSSADESKQPDLFSNIPEDFSKKSAPQEETKPVNKYQEVPDEEQKSNVYKYKHTQSTDIEVESVLILLSNGKFRSYRPE